ncbi:MAG: GNAT family N-acetyltransferase [Thermoflexales bacterium]|nr:GNAT family N-acetyltransferase [Thermoflexales bacterium]
MTASRLEHLQRSRRRLDRLDHWTVAEWSETDALVVFGAAARLEAAALIVPLNATAPAPLSTLRGDPAWVRWISIADGAATEASLRGLLDEVVRRAGEAGLSDLYVLSDESERYDPVFLARGFHEIDAVTTLFLPSGDFQQTEPSRVIRPYHAAQLNAVAAVDAAAFHVPWIYPPGTLKRELDRAAVARVAEQGGAVVGYVSAVQGGVRGHINRLAVAPAAQGGGLGRALLAACITALRQRGVQSISLNTQRSNVASLRLYHAAGFCEVGAPLPVYHLPLT